MLRTIFAFALAGVTFANVPPGNSLPKPAPQPGTFIGDVTIVGSATTLGESRIALLLDTDNDKTANYLFLGQSKEVASLVQGEQLFDVQTVWNGRGVDVYIGSGLVFSMKIDPLAAERSVHALVGISAQNVEAQRFGMGSAERNLKLNALIKRVHGRDGEYDCEAGGVGSESCSIDACGTPSCSISCGAGYYSCCNCWPIIGALCTCDPED